MNRESKAQESSSLARLDAELFAADVVGAGGRVLSQAEDRLHGAFFLAAQSGRVLHVLATSPRIGREHHLIVPCGLRSPIALGVVGEQIGGATWTAGVNGDDTELAMWLSRQHALRAIAARLSFTGVSEDGKPPSVLSWVVQLRAAGEGRGQLLVRTGYGDGRLGVTELVALVDRFRAVLPPPPFERQRFVVEPAFLDQAEAALGVFDARRPPLSSDIVPSRSARRRHDDTVPEGTVTVPIATARVEDLPTKPCAVSDVDGPSAVHPASQSGRRRSR